MYAHVFSVSVCVLYPHYTGVIAKKTRVSSPYLRAQLSADRGCGSRMVQSLS